MKILNKKSCDVSFQVLDESGKVIISETRNVTSDYTDSEMILAELKNTVQEVIDDYKAKEDGKVAHELSKLIGKELDL